MAPTAKTSGLNNREHSYVAEPSDYYPLIDGLVPFTGEHPDLREEVGV